MKQVHWDRLTTSQQLLLMPRIAIKIASLVVINTCCIAPYTPRTMSRTACTYIFVLLSSCVCNQTHCTSQSNPMQVAFHCFNTTKYMFSFKFEGRSMGDLLTTKVFLPWFTVNRETHVRTKIRRQIVGEFKYLTCTTSLAASLVLESQIVRNSASMISINTYLANKPMTAGLFK